MQEEEAAGKADTQGRKDGRKEGAAPPDTSVDTGGRGRGKGGMT